MKITLEFDKNSPDWDEFDQCELNATLKAKDLALCIWEIEEYMRNGKMRCNS
jgi:hypothetical protein